MDAIVSSTGKTLRITRGDITRVKAGAIVNAANSALAGGGGVDGAIHRAAGSAVMSELREIRAAIGSCPPGKAVITGAGRLDASYIIHAVGPVYEGGHRGEAEVLASCYRESLRLAAGKGLTSIAFAAISTGVYGYPLDRAAEIAIREIRAFLEQPGPIETATMVLFDQTAFDAFQEALAAVQRDAA